LHLPGSNNPLGVNLSVDRLPFFSFFFLKDVFSWLFFFILLAVFVFFFSNTLGHTDNYLEANPMVTPAHVVPEWYFLPFYAILRSIPHKLGGVIAMFGSIVALGILPMLHTVKIRSSIFRPLYRFIFALLAFTWLLLGWIGGNAPEAPFLEIGQVATTFYFFWMLVLIPSLGIFENHLIAT
jgi:quinol-cytochrome oxidoreductase complex cytochrome b subunit